MQCMQWEAYIHASTMPASSALHCLNPQPSTHPQPALSALCCMRRHRPVHLKPLQPRAVETPRDPPPGLARYI
jgi:hypothetical protein